MSNDLMSNEDKAGLELAQRTRMNIISAMTPGGKLPENEEDRNFLLKALDGSDKQILTRAKIKSDDQNGKTQAAAAAMVATMLLRVQNQKGPEFNRGGVPELPAVELDLLPGETHIGVQTFQLVDIMKPQA